MAEAEPSRRRAAPGVWLFGTGAKPWCWGAIVGLLLFAAVLWLVLAGIDSGRYLLLHRYGETNATYLERLLAAAERLSAGMMRCPEVARHVRRFACLDVAFDDRGKLAATTRWLHRAPR